LHRLSHKNYKYVNNINL